MTAKKKVEKPDEANEMDTLVRRVDGIARTLGSISDKMERHSANWKRFCAKFVSKSGGGKVEGNTSIGMIFILVLSMALVAPAAEKIVQRLVAPQGLDAVMELCSDLEDDTDDELQWGIDASANSYFVSIGGDTILSITAEGVADIDDLAVDSLIVNGAITHGGLIVTNDIGTVGAPTVTTVEYGDKAMKRVVITLADHVLEIDGSAAVGFGGTNIYTFAEGLVRIHTVVCDGFTLTPDEADLEAGEGGDFSIGSTQTADVTLDGTDVNFIASTSIDPIETATDVVNTTAFDLDGHTTAAAIYINALADDADVATISTNTLTAVITVTYSNLGDY